MKTIGRPRKYKEEYFDEILYAMIRMFYRERNNTPISRNAIFKMLKKDHKYDEIYKSIKDVQLSSVSLAINRYIEYLIDHDIIVQVETRKKYGRKGFVIAYKLKKYEKAIKKTDNYRNLC